MTLEELVEYVRALEERVSSLEHPKGSSRWGVDMTDPLR